MNLNQDHETTENTTASTPSEVAEPSIRDTLIAAMETAQSEPSADTEKPSQQRDQTGRFTTSQQPAKAQQPTVNSATPAPDNSGTSQGQAPSAQAAPAGEQSSQGAQPSAPDLTKAPHTWNPLERETWASIPDAAKAAIARRESDMAKAISRHDGDRLFGQTVKQVVSKYAQTIPQGHTPESTVEAMLSAHAHMAMSPPQKRVELLLNLGKSYGVDLTAHFAQQGGVQTDPTGQQKPAVVDPRFESLQSQLQGVTQQLQQFQSQREQQAQGAVQSQIEAFASDPKNEFFADVEPMMAQLITAGLATGLSDAYEQACKLHSPTAAVLAQRATQSKQANSQQQVLRAKAAGSSVTGSPGKTTRVATTLGSLRETIEAAAAQHGVG